MARGPRPNIASNPILIQFTAVRSPSLCQARSSAEAQRANWTRTRQSRRPAPSLPPAMPRSPDRPAAARQSGQRRQSLQPMRNRKGISCCPLDHRQGCVMNLLRSIEPAIYEFGLMQRSIEIPLGISIGFKQLDRVGHRHLERGPRDRADAAVVFHAERALPEDDRPVRTSVHTHVKEHVVAANRNQVAPWVPIFTMINRVDIGLGGFPDITASLAVLLAPGAVFALRDAARCATTVIRRIIIVASL